MTTDTPPAMTGAEVAERLVAIIAAIRDENDGGDEDEEAVVAARLLVAENARLRQERDKLFAELMKERGLRRHHKAEADELAQQRDAERERYTRLVGEVERIAEHIDPPPARVYGTPQDAYRYIAGRLRSALAATAPQTAPAQPAVAKLRCTSCDHAADMPANAIHAKYALALGQALDAGSSDTTAGGTQ